MSFNRVYYTPPGHGPVANREPGESYLKTNFELHRAIDMTKVSIVLDKLVKQGLPEGQAKTFKAMAEGLLDLIAGEHSRIYAAQLKEFKPDDELPWDDDYRILSVGEIIERGDEVQLNDGIWRPAARIGQEAPRIGYSARRAYRRRKEPENDV